QPQVVRPALLAVLCSLLHPCSLLPAFFPFPFSACVFFILRLPNSTSTLFPYTTLFRSIYDDAEQCFNEIKADVFIDLTIPEVGYDRKSTRLNSSHVSISYAVFCLKKKNV